MPLLLHAALAFLMMIMITVSNQRLLVRLSHAGYLVAVNTATICRTPGGGGSEPDSLSDDVDDSPSLRTISNLKLYVYTGIRIPPVKNDENGVGVHSWL
jgi:hypothetical protein